MRGQIVAFTPENFLMAERAMNQIGVDATAYFTNMDRAIEQMITASANLSGMAAAWTSTVTFIDAQAAANPGDASWQALLARKDKIVVDFIAMRDLTAAVKDAAVAARG